MKVSALLERWNEALLARVQVPISSAPQELMPFTAADAPRRLHAARPARSSSARPLRRGFGFLAAAYGSMGGMDRWAR